MLHHVLKVCNQDPRTAECEKLVIHADNCAGQNKNRFTLWFLCWLVCSGLYSEIELLFLVSGHTKNICDIAFGHIKRKFHRTPVRVPADRCELINLVPQTLCASTHPIKFGYYEKIYLLSISLYPDLSNFFIIMCLNSRDLNRELSVFNI